jgi:hypothetical protein
MRPFVTSDQTLAGDGDTDLFPATGQALRRRNAALRTLSGLPAERAHAEYSALTLPDHH